MRLAAIRGHQFPQHHAEKHDGDPEENCFCRRTGIHVVLTFVLGLAKIPLASTRLANLSNLLLASLPSLHLRSSVGESPMIPPRPIVRSQAVPDPYIIRCCSEPKVIGFQAHAPPPGLVQQYRQSQRPGLAFAKPPQKEFLRHAALQHRVEQQNIPALQLRPGAEINFSPRMPAIIHVSHILAHEMANHRGVNLANQIGGKDEATVKCYNHVHSPPPVGPRDFSSKRYDPRANSRGGKSRTARRIRLDRWAVTHQDFSSAIKIPVRVLSLAANPAATGKPRDNTRPPPLVSAGQPSRSHRLMRFSFKSRFSLWAFWCPAGCSWSPKRQLRSTSGKRTWSRSKTAPDLLVSPLFATQSITLRRKTHPACGTRKATSPLSKSILYSYSASDDLSRPPFPTILRSGRDEFAQKTKASRSRRTSTPPGSCSTFPFSPCSAKSTTARMCRPVICPAPLFLSSRRRRSIRLVSAKVFSLFSVSFVPSS